MSNSILPMIVLFVFFYYILKLFFNSTSVNRENVIDSVSQMFEAYSDEVIVEYEKNIKEIEELLENGDRKGAKEKSEEFKRNVKKTVEVLNKQMEDFKAEIKNKGK